MPWHGGSVSGKLCSLHKWGSKFKLELTFLNRRQPLALPFLCGAILSFGRKGDEFISIFREIK